jgi:hypothetical protein
MGPLRTPKKAVVWSYALQEVSTDWVEYDKVFMNLVFPTEAYNVDRQLCCGRLGSEKILMKEHKDSICCGDVQYNPQTQRCCGDPPEINELSVSCETDCKQVLTQEPTGLHPSHYFAHFRE